MAKNRRSDRQRGRSRDQGKVVEVGIIEVGDETILPHVAGSTVIYLNDTADFDESGGGVSISGTVYWYDSMDDDAHTITLAGSGLSEDIPDEHPVLLYPPAQEKWAGVILEEEDDLVYARIPQSMANNVDDGIREDLEQESAVVELDGTEWIVIDIVGQSETTATEASQTVVFTQDTFVLSEAGAQVLSLVYEPILNSKHVYWNGLYQKEGEAWTSEGAGSVSLTGLPHPAQISDVVVVEYAYYQESPPLITKDDSLWWSDPSINSPQGYPTDFQAGQAYTEQSINTYYMRIPITAFVSDRPSTTEFTFNLFFRVVTEPAAGSNFSLQGTPVDGAPGVYVTVAELVNDALPSGTEQMWTPGWAITTGTFDPSWFPTLEIIGVQFAKPGSSGESNLSVDSQWDLPQEALDGAPRPWLATTNGPASRFYIGEQLATMLSPFDTFYQAPTQEELMAQGLAHYEPYLLSFTAKNQALQV